MRSLNCQQCGGQITIRVHRPTIGSASADNFVAIITDSNGNELVRRRGSDRSIPNHSGGNWWGILIVWIPEGINGDLNVRVVDRLGNEVSDFKVKVDSHAG